MNSYIFRNKRKQMRSKDIINLLVGYLVGLSLCIYGAATISDKNSHLISATYIITGSLILVVMVCANYLVYFHPRNENDYRTLEEGTTHSRR